MHPVSAVDDAVVHAAEKRRRITEVDGTRTIISSLQEEDIGLHRNQNHALRAFSVVDSCVFDNVLTLSSHRLCSWHTGQSADYRFIDLLRNVYGRGAPCYGHTLGVHDIAFFTPAIYGERKWACRSRLPMSI